jgi:hypothetical protein
MTPCGRHAPTAYTGIEGDAVTRSMIFENAEAPVALGVRNGPAG